MKDANKSENKRNQKEMNFTEENMNMCKNIEKVQYIMLKKVIEEPKNENKNNNFPLSYQNFFNK